MELEELKNEWQRLDRRLEGLEQRLDRMAVGVANGAFRSSRDRLRRRFRLTVVIALLLPLNFWGAFCRYDAGEERLPLLAGCCLFAAVALVQQLLLLDGLGRIDPAVQTLREACAAVIRLRRLFLRGVTCCLPLAAGWCIWLGAVLWRAGDTYLLYGFAAGLVVGLPLGCGVFLRIRREIDTLQTALERAEA